MQGETVIEVPHDEFLIINDDKMHKYVDNVYTEKELGDRKKLGHRIRDFRERLQI